MKKMTLGIIAIIGCLFTTAQKQVQWKAAAGAPVPGFRFLPKGQADSVSIHAYEGKVVLINFFATWCGPCRAELPRVQKEIWEVYKNNPDFALFVFGREETKEKLDSFVKRTAFTFPVLADPERKIFSQFADQFIPRNVVIDKDGKIIYQSIGYDNEEFEKLLSVLKEHLQ
ncbi:hypothetical protein A8C56_11410 [Niabella ginsenosidivorans]|uniref:Thioredoxin domain-containing protein n=1 Tax=Niabella ginsenosidivorans TaxID=1176587 RepID=A0A1A9I1V0_9BACT|nr:TlpA disulfide reductase family protein [Niabella ginsenosidivorans]ANH81503.1 hypothetical protein A8C56_11410 [Niabella ginsenosidivorans]